jgi:elongation factor G
MSRDVPLHRLRNIGIMAHIDAGKTTCTERMLYYTGLIHRMGEVHDGTATTDFDPEEQRRGITISAATVTTSWEPRMGSQRGVSHRIRIIDTPGHVDFAVEVERSLRVLDGAVFVLDASAGVECQSEAVWRQADRYEVPRVTFVNKMDKVGADFGRCLAEMRERLGARPFAVQLPLGEERDHRGVIDLLHMRALRFGDVRESMVCENIPDDLVADAIDARATLAEACAEIDQEVLDTWAAGGMPSAESLERALRKGMLAGSMHVVLCGSALGNKGIEPLLDAIVAYLPSPADRPPAQGEDPRTAALVVCRPDENEPFAAIAFKTQSDARGTLTFLRIYSGRLARGDTVVVCSRDERERIGRLYVVHASDREEVTCAYAGDIVAALGLRHTKTGDTLASAIRPVVFESIVVPEPVLEVALEPKTSSDRERLGQGLARLVSDDPSLRIRVDEESGQTVLSAMGELHVEIAMARLERDHGVRVRVGRPAVAYRDTVARHVRVDHKLAKQTGGPGQYARVVLEVAAGARGSGVDFADETTGGAVPVAFVSAVEKGVRGAAARGVRNGYPLVDLRVRLVDGDHHVKDSSGLAFEIAAAAAVQKAVRDAGLVLLEPVMTVEVTVPEEHVGSVIGDLVSRRGAVHKVTPRAAASVVEGRVPLATLFGYVPVLRGISHGRGTAVMNPAGYEIVPEKAASLVLAK